MELGDDGQWRERLDAAGPEADAAARRRAGTNIITGALGFVSTGQTVWNALLPDRGDRYLSTMLFMSVCAKCPP